MTTSTREAPRAAALPHGTAMRMAATEYRRWVDLLRSLRAEDWTRPTECPGWDVRAVASHVLGMVDIAASYREQRRQIKLARGRGGVFIDELTALQVEERAGMAPGQIVEGLAARAPKAARRRRLTPGFVRGRRLDPPQRVGDRDEPWTIGYLFDVILTRDPWMHRVDVVRATGAEHVLTADHDGVLVADVVAEWADRHGQPYTLRLTGPAGGTFESGHGGPAIEMDAIEFCRVLCGRDTARAEGLLDTFVPF
ncbi:maleylpyruvate isomerase family mycothiol-dependent enzyme [Actinomadura sp. 9N407]|uniref:maleylpyruvate isomerase family mycothiol-dependent enzyme n=1 Tax=Actinomadura sp. 9N407 TaxID=3375154 RepID=UPI00378E0B73